MLISSQRYRDEDVVAVKLEAEDFDVYVIETTVDGIDYQVVVDGHHSYEAAKRAGKEPVIRIRTPREDDRASLDSETLLETCYMDSDWYDLETGSLVF